jgi:hypothetical protein
MAEFVAGGGGGPYGGFRTQAEYDKAVADKAAADALALQQLMDYQPTGASAYGDLYTRAAADPSLLRKFAGESDADALMRLKANIMDAEQRLARRQAVRQQIESVGENMAVSGTPYGDSLIFGGESAPTSVQSVGDFVAGGTNVPAGVVTTGTTGAGAYDPQALFQLIYGRQGTADEVAALAGKSEADARAILEQSISRFQNTQFPFRGAQMFTPQVVGQPTVQDRFQQIYGRPGTAQEVANLAGMSDDQVRAVLTGALAQYRFDQPAQQTIARDLQQYVSMAPGSQFNPFYGGGVSPYQRVMGQMPAFENPYANVPINAPLGGFDPLLYERRLPIATTGENYYVTNLIDGSTGGDSGGVGDSGGSTGEGGGMGNTGEGGPGSVGGWAMGGLIDRVGGANPPGPDDGLGMLQLGEYVIKKSSVNKYGKGLLDAINAGKPAKKIKSLLD